MIACSAWADGCRRGMFMPSDRLLWAALHDDRLAGVVVANPFRSGPIRTARRLTGAIEPPLPSGPAARVQITPQRLRRRDPVNVAAIRRSYGRYDRALQEASARLGLDAPVVVCGNPFVAAYSPLAWTRSVTYYAWDDWAAYPPDRRWWAAYEAAYERIRHRRLPVVAVSQVLLDRLAPTGPTLLLPNGLAVDEWRSPGKAPGWFASLPAPRFLYIGTLDDRLDVDAVVAVADRFPDASMVLVGHEVGGAMDRLRSRPNVHVIPAVSRAEVAAIVHTADVCLMPHRRTPLTEAMSPLKLFEYAAGGRPVVASDLPPARGVAKHLTLVANADFPAAVAAALHRSALSEQERLAFVERNSWDSRFEDFFAFIWPDSWTPR